MTFSLKKIFKKEETNKETKAVIQQQASTKSTEDAKAEQKAEQKGKHGEPGVCCGSCS